jgi:hypothetical protein
VIEIGYQWLTLLPNETDPRVLESVRPSLVVWSSLWPSTPEIVIHFDIAADADRARREHAVVRAARKLRLNVVVHMLHTALWKC